MNKFVLIGIIVLVVTIVTIHISTTNATSQQQPGTTATTVKVAA